MKLLLSIAVPLIFIYLFYKKRNASKTLAPPGPRGLPFIGNLHQFVAASDPHIYLWRLSKIYGPIMQMKFGSLPLLVVSSAKCAKEVMKTQDLSFCSRPKHLGQQKLSYQGLDMLFSPYGDLWRELRKITAVHLLNVKQVQSFHLAREEEVSRVISKIKRISDSSAGLRVVNFSDMALALSSNLVCRIAFSRRYDDNGTEIRKFEKLTHEAQAAMAASYMSDYLPLFGSVVDRLNGSIHHLNTIFRDLDSFYQELIDEHLDPRQAKKMEEEEDILDILIKLKENKSNSVNLGWDHIKALLLDIFVGTIDTSTVSTVWAMTALIKEPKVMRKVQEEIRNLVGEKGKVDEDDVQKLSYLKAVVREALRLYPPAPLIPREAIQASTIQGYQIQPKTLVFINTWAIARDPEHWENANDFVPERFLNGSTDVTGQDYGALPFGSGRRICPGMSMGLAIVELAIANFLYSFDWQMPPGIQAQDIDTQVLPGLAMYKKNPLMLVATDYIV